MRGRIPQSFIQDCLSRVDIIDIIDTRLPLKKAGQNFQACCPFHNEKSPSFTVSQSKQFYHCFGCGQNGNALSFLLEHDHLNFIEAVEVLAQEAGLDMPVLDKMETPTDNLTPLYNLMAKANDFYQKKLREDPENNPAIAYLKKRGLTGETAKFFNIGYAPDSWDGLIKVLKDKGNLEKTGLAIKKNQDHFYDRFRNRIQFPIRDRMGKVIGFGGRVINPDDQPKYLNSPETPLFHKSNALYGIYEARQKPGKLENIIVVEGYMDVVALYQYGFTNTVATLGTAITDSHIKQLSRLSDKVIFCFDGDTAGKKAAWKALETCLPLVESSVTFQFMFLPDGMDPDDFLRQWGEKTFRKQINSSHSLLDFFFEELSSQIDLTTLDGRGKLVELAKPYLKNMPQGVYQQLAIDKCASLSKIKPHQLNNLLFGTPRVMQHQASPFIQNNNKHNSPMRLAIALLIQHPELAQEVVDIAPLKNNPIPGMPLLVQLLEQLHQQPNLTTGSLLELWRETEQSPQLAKLASFEHLVPESGIKTEFLASIQHVKNQEKQQEIAILLQKAQSEGLSEAEKAHLQQLIANKASTN